MDDNNDGLFYVIDYDAANIEGVGRFVLQPQKIEPPVKDEIKERFHSMRDIARANRPSYFGNNRFFEHRVQRENAVIFYKQGMFMKDFTDNYKGNTEYKEYFPYYQLMSYEQLRTYFTWRSDVRKGNVAVTSLSYVFLYIYELLNNIGVDNPQDGLDKLMTFWKSYSTDNKTIDKYVLRWLKDYHIYYQMPQSFKDFVENNNLTSYYPKLADTGDNFELFCAISKYDIKSSSFFTGDNVKLVIDCFYFVTDKLRQLFFDNGIHFDESIFQPTKKMTAWQPFKGALFHPWLKQPDRRIVLSENEIYICKQNIWTFSTVITTESGRQLIGYMMKQIESVLRTVTKYKYKLTANVETVTHEVVGKLSKAGLSLEKLVTAAVMEFYRETTKTVVSVDHSALSRIRQEALSTQEKLIIEETPVTQTPLNLSISAPQETAITDAWESLKTALNETEIQALLTVMHGEADIKKFADDNGIMLEVLIDGINEKAMDFVGDNLLDDEFTIYDEYIEQVKELVG